MSRTSRRIADSARRSELLSLERNFKDLFIRPAEQAARLQAYLDTQKEDASLRVGSTGDTIQLRLDRPKTVHKFSICIEHFGGLTSSKGSARHGADRCLRTVGVRAIPRRADTGTARLATSFRGGILCPCSMYVSFIT